MEPNLASVLRNENIQLPDVKCSFELLNGLILSKQLNPISCLDCAAGIGRVTEYVLSNFFQEIDKFEKDKVFLEKNKTKFLGILLLLKYFISKWIKEGINPTNRHIILLWKIFNLKENMI